MFEGVPTKIMFEFSSNYKTFSNLILLSLLQLDLELFVYLLPHVD